MLAGLDTHIKRINIEVVAKFVVGTGMFNYYQIGVPGDALTFLGLHIVSCKYPSVMKRF